MKTLKISIIAATAIFFVFLGFRLYFPNATPSTAPTSTSAQETAPPPTVTHPLAGTDLTIEEIIAFGKNAAPTRGFALYSVKYFDGYRNAPLHIAREDMARLPPQYRVALREDTSFHAEKILCFSYTGGPGNGREYFVQNLDTKSRKAYHREGFIEFSTGKTLLWDELDAPCSNENLGQIRHGQELMK